MISGLPILRLTNWFSTLQHNEISNRTLQRGLQDIPTNYFMGFQCSSIRFRINPTLPRGPWDIPRSQKKTTSFWATCTKREGSKPRKGFKSIQTIGSSCFFLRGSPVLVVLKGNQKESRHFGGPNPRKRTGPIYPWIIRAQLTNTTRLQVVICPKDVKKQKQKHDRLAAQ